MRRFFSYIFLAQLFFCGGTVLSHPLLQGNYKLKVVAELANVRQTPNIGSPILKQISEGTLILSSERSGDWFKVSVQGPKGNLLSGYVHYSLVSVEEAPDPRSNAGDRVDTEVLTQEKLKPPVAEKKSPPPKEKSGGSGTPDQIPVKEKPGKTREGQMTGTVREKAPSALPPIDIYLSGGGGLFSLGDLNTGARGLADFYADYFGSPPDGEISPLGMYTVFSGDIAVSLYPKISVGIGADYMDGKKTSRISYVRGLSESIYATRPEIRALPVRVFVLYNMSPHFYAKIGMEYCFTRCRYFYRLEDENFWQQWRGEARASGLGALGGFGMTLDLSSRLGFYFEVDGRYTKIDGFRGTDHYEDSTGLKSIENGKMYYYTAEVTGGNNFSLLYIRSRTPSEPGVVGPREAWVNFSGLAIKAGLLIRF
jgi:hypothetical protein